jgi:predicted O-methyltransferase YrrM
MDNKAAKLFRVFSALFQHPKRILQVLDDNAWWEKKVKKAYGITSFPVIRIENLIPELLEEGVEVSPYAFLEGGSMLTDLLILRALVRRTKDCRYFEIGTWRGESVVNVAAEGAECHTLNLSDAEMEKLGLDAAYRKQVGILLKGHPGIHLHRGHSAHFDYAALGKKFNLIFIDGDHHYQAVKADTRNVFEHLLHPKGILCWHDYAWHPEAVRHEIMAGILDGLPASVHSRLYHISHSKMAILLPEQTNAVPFVAPASPDLSFQVEIKAKKTSLP